MRRIILVPAAFAAVSLIGGCGLQPRSVHDQPRCQAAQCPITVMAAADVGGKCQVAVDQPHLYVKMQPLGVTLKWTFDGAAQGYSFHVTPPPPAGVEFTDPQFTLIHADDRLVIWKDATTIAGGPFKYTVYAARNGVACDPLDPFIYNQ